MSASLARLGPALAAGALAVALASPRFRPATAGLVGFDLGAAVLLALTWVHIFRFKAPHATQARAAADDPGRTAVYAVVLVGSAASLLAATVLSRKAGTVAPGDEAVHVALCLGAVAASWGLTHTAFTMRYAHLYYRGEAAGGLEFPGTSRPGYLDFAYFAFTVGMCFQVSDCAVTGPRLRPAVLAQALLSFAYNTVILAFTLTLVFGAAT